VEEYWDLYDKDKNRLNKVRQRGEWLELPADEYFLAVNVWIINDKQEILLSQRHPDKTWPLQWECCSGAVIAGEDSYTSALREVNEEIGIDLKTNGELIETVVLDDYIKDIYLFRENIDLSATTLESGSVIGIKWVTIEEFKAMEQNGEIIEPNLYDMIKLAEIIKW
jgi:isopentenyldiphosphate isomerase